MPSTVVESTIGENKGRSDIDPYTSLVDYVNVLPVCKVTTSGGALLYRSYTMGTGSSAKTFYVPAVYTELTGEDGALAALDGTFYSGSEVGVSPSYDIAGGVQVQMLVSGYTLGEAVSLGTDKKVALTTAAADDTSFPYQGAGTTSTIRRGYQGASMFTVNGDLTLGTISLDGVKGSYTVDVDGGIAYVPSGGHLAIQSGAILQNSRTAQRGGAVYVASGGVVAMTGGTIQRNESVGDGSGVYLELGATLNLSGNPYFGGTGLDIADNIYVGDGNYKDGTFDLVNGGKAYTRARQDIFIAGYEGVDAASLAVNGALTAGNGTIWVWAADNPHYLQEGQFAVVRDTGNPGNLAAFRNAQDDATASNETGTYLYGVAGDGSNIAWSGIPGARPVVLQKVNTNHDPLAGGLFTIFRGNSTSAYIVKRADNTTETLINLSANDNGTIWVGELPYGKYCIYEAQAPSGYSANDNKWFVLEVTETSITMSDGYFTRPQL